MVINLNGYNSRVKKYCKDLTYRRVMRDLHEGREKILHVKMPLILLIFNWKKKNPHWDKKLVDGQSPTARSLFTEESSDGEYV